MICRQTFSSRCSKHPITTSPLLLIHRLILHRISLHDYTYIDTYTHTLAYFALENLFFFSSSSVVVVVVVAVVVITLLLLLLLRVRTSRSEDHRDTCAY